MYFRVLTAFEGNWLAWVLSWGRRETEITRLLVMGVLVDVVGEGGCKAISFPEMLILRKSLGRLALSLLSLLIDFSFSGIAN